MGVCIGLLTASALSCSRSLVDMIPLATETVRTAFRLGNCVGRMARLQEPAVYGSKSWTSLVTGVSSQAVVSAVHVFNKTQVGSSKLSNSSAISHKRSTS